MSPSNAEGTNMRIVKSAALAAALLATAGAVQAQETAMPDETRVLATIESMTSAFAAGDIDRIMSTYAPGAVVVGEPGQPTRGDAALRAMFAAFIESGVSFNYGEHEVVIAGDTALHLMKWTAPGPDGTEASALSVAVLRRQPDGAWKMVIDHPSGDRVMRDGL
ncbi:SgcJ/EcaC family oxidoreductase [Phenylobacterium sp.]|uniref:YybH family protein n=1 Tax=Phenylobacterium sp. TaxID=1871053 RepID=UPI0025E0814B|nr:SgcJ/EcaC family oxidoreductase [Phenylobacterium sp.]